MEIAAYADDLVIMENGYIKLNKAIDVVESWATKAKMQINKKKSGILLHNKKNIA